MPTARYKIYSCVNFILHILLYSMETAVMFYDRIMAVFHIYMYIQNITVEEKGGLCYNVDIKQKQRKPNEDIQCGKF